MTVRELIDSLSKCDPNDIILILNCEDIAVGSVEDVLIGTDIDRGFSFLKIETNEDWV